MQRWLPIKKHNIAVLQVALHFVAWLQMDIAVLAPVAQVEALPVLPDDEASTSLARRWVGAVLYQLLQPAEVARADLARSRCHVQTETLSARYNIRAETQEECHMMSDTTAWLAMQVVQGVG